MYHYTAINEVLLNKNIIHHINVVTKLTRTQLDGFINYIVHDGYFLKLVHKKNQPIHLYCFSKYQKYSCIFFLFYDHSKW